MSYKGVDTGHTDLLFLVFLHLFLLVLSCPFVFVEKSFAIDRIVKILSQQESAFVIIHAAASVTISSLCRHRLA